jgi:hypothetical protein
LIIYIRCLDKTRFTYQSKENERFMIKDLRKGDNSLLNELKAVKINVDFASRLLKRLSLSERVIESLYRSIKRATFEKCDCRLMFRLSLISILILIVSLFITPKVLAGPVSSNYQVIDYGFGAGGTTNSNSTNYALQGIAGELEMASPSSANYIVWPGLTYTIQPGVPAAPIFTNPSNTYYNKLSLSINQGNNLSDTTYAISVSTEAFVNNIMYVQADGTLGTKPVWQIYTVWQPSANPVIIIGLAPGTTYYARVAAGRGAFTDGPFGPADTAATINPTFTFGLQTTNQAVPPYTVGIGAVNPGQVLTSWQKITATITTNAYTGGTVYVSDSNAGLKSANGGNYTIASVQNDLNSGGVTQGYGARGVSVSASTGTMELLSPYNLGGNNVGPLATTKNPIADSFSAPVGSGTVNFELKVKASTSTPPETDYSDTITVVGSGSF